MKRYGNLYDTIISVENLRLADEKARKGKKKSYGVRIFDKDKENNLQRLHEVLASGEFRTSQYSTFFVYEPKERKIYRLPYYPDRILHHAIMNVMEKIWVNTMTADTYACVKTRGIHKCAKKIKHDLKGEKNIYCLKTDIRKFYPSIDHDTLKCVVRRKIKDKKLLKLLDEIIDSTDGVPIGNYLSQYFANIYLSELDHIIKEKFHIKYYYRYADDTVILSHSKQTLHRVEKFMNEYLSGIKLNLKGNWRIFPVAKNVHDNVGCGIDFMGYVFYLEHTRLRKAIKKNFIKQAIKIGRHHLTLKLIRTYDSAWNGWCKHANAINLHKKIKNKVYEINTKQRQATNMVGCRKRKLLLPFQHQGN